MQVCASPHKQFLGPGRFLGGGEPIPIILFSITFDFETIKKQEPHESLYNSNNKLKSHHFGFYECITCFLQLICHCLQRSSINFWHLH